MTDAELMDLAVPIQTLARRVLVMYIYISSKAEISLDELDAQLALEAEEELKKRASLMIRKVRGYKIRRTADIP
jgi:hypothetical protein